MGAELRGVPAPHRRVSVDERDEDYRPVLWAQGVAVTNHGVRVRAARERRGGRPEAQCLVEGTPSVTKLRHLLEGGLRVGISPQDRVSFGLRLGPSPRVSGEVAERK